MLRVYKEKNTPHESDLPLKDLLNDLMTRFNNWLRKSWHVLTAHLHVTSFFTIHAS